MATDTRTVKATCLCGAAAHEITLAASAYPLKVMFCHCDSDRHLTGTLCLGIAVLPQAYQPSDALIGKLQTYDFSETVVQYHCLTCGTLSMVRIDRGDAGIWWDVCTGTLEKVDGVVETDCHEWLADTVDGGFGDFLQDVAGKQVRRWAYAPHKSEQLPLHWRSPSMPAISSSPDDKLHAYCKCKGVQFWISRPSKRSMLGRGAHPDDLVPFDESAPEPESAWWLRDSGSKYLAGCCSCDSCRLATGQEWFGYAHVPDVNITLDEAGRMPFPRDFGTLKHYRSSDKATRHFCSVCGASVFWDGDEQPHLLDIAVGLLDAAEGARAESWLEWRVTKLTHREDALPRAGSLVLGVEAGLEAYRKRHESRV